MTTAHEANSHKLQRVRSLEQMVGYAADMMVSVEDNSAQDVVLDRLANYLAAAYTLGTADARDLILERIAFDDGAEIGGVAVRSDTIVAYTYQADIYHGTCVIELMVDQGATPKARDLQPEEALDRLANVAHIDRYSEDTYDSGDFPKVVFADMLDPAYYTRYCGRCGKVIA